MSLHSSVPERHALIRERKEEEHHLPSAKKIRKEKKEEETKELSCPLEYDLKKVTMTLTYSECVENHAKMQQIGKKSTTGFSVEQLDRLFEWLKTRGFHVEMLELNNGLPKVLRNLVERATVLIVRKALTQDAGDKVLLEMLNQTLDKKAYMRGRVVNKRARYNNCVADFRQDADFEDKKGTVLHHEDVPYATKVRDMINGMLTQVDAPTVPFFETNLYYDPKECGIGFHGDTERSLVAGARFGKSMNLQYMWFARSLAVGKRINVTLDHGDIYFMSYKATGNDWKSSSKLTLRHCAGSKKYSKVKRYEFGNALDMDAFERGFSAAHRVSLEEGKRLCAEYLSDRK